MMDLQFCIQDLERNIFFVSLNCQNWPRIQAYNMWVWKIFFKQILGHCTKKYWYHPSWHSHHCQNSSHCTWPFHLPYSPSHQGVTNASDALLRFQSIIFALQFYLLCKCFGFLCFGLGFLCCYKWVSFFGLDVVCHLGYFYVMCCECGDNDGYRCRHRNAQQGQPTCLQHMSKSTIEFLFQS